MRKLMICTLAVVFLAVLLLITDVGTSNAFTKDIDEQIECFCEKKFDNDAEIVTCISEKTQAFNNLRTLMKSRRNLESARSEMFIMLLLITSSPVDNECSEELLAGPSPDWSEIYNKVKKITERNDQQQPPGPPEPKREMDPDEEAEF